MIVVVMMERVARKKRRRKVVVSTENIAVVVTVLVMTTGERVKRKGVDGEVTVQETKVTTKKRARKIALDLVTGRVMTTKKAKKSC